MRWKLLLRPGWLALTLVVFSFAVCCYTLLAPWQFERHEDRSRQNSAVESSFTERPRVLAEVLPAGQAPGPGTAWRRIVVEGTYLPEAEVIARLRTVQGEPAFEVLTPLRTESGRVVLVDRGYLRPDDGDVPRYAPPPGGLVRLEARIRSDETDPQQRELFADASTQGRLHSYAIDSRAVGRAAGLEISPGYLQLAADQPGVLSALPLPKLEAGPYFSYALQWIAFGTMAILGWGYFTIRELKPGGALAEQRSDTRRKSVAEQLAEDEELERRAARARQESGTPPENTENTVRAHSGGSADEHTS